MPYKMYFKTVFCLVLFLSGVSSSYNSTIDYYVNLMTEEALRAHTYPRPLDSSAHKPGHHETEVYGTYDYVIVGAGSAGSVVASRLTEVERNKIILLEAGGEETDFSDIPYMNTYLQGLEYNWNYNSTPQDACCLGMIDNACPHPRGKVLGGSSSINVLIYARGNKKDYDDWCQQGNPGWSYDEILKYFKRSEDSHINGDVGFHGKGGYLNVEYHEPDSPQFHAFIDANLELGRKIVDYNGKEQLGVAKIQHHSIKGSRLSTAKAFLLPVLNRTNLEILTNSLAIKILVDSATKKAYGVLFSHKNRLLVVKAHKEVIISAGAIGSPQLLMLSGIGPAAHLCNLGIPVLQDLAVGRNLQDHPAYVGLHIKSNYTQRFQSLEKAVEEYLSGYGQLAIAGNSQGLGFLQTQLEKTPGYPDIEVIVSPSSSHPIYFDHRVFNFDDETLKALGENSDPSNTFRILVLLLHPKSKGDIKLKSSDPYDYPLIDNKFLSDAEERDIETLYEGIQLVLEMLETNAFKKFNATLNYAPLSPCQKHEYLSKTYWYCQLRHLTTSLHHLVGTCKMGPNSSSGAVVNHELKVHGIYNLRVADASIIPEAISGHTNAAAIMIGEKAAELIRYGK